MRPIILPFVYSKRAAATRSPGSRYRRSNVLSPLRGSHLVSMLAIGSLGSWQRLKAKVPEPKVPKSPTKWTIAFEAELAARRVREEAVRFDGCTVYCAKHRYTLENEMCSTCAKKVWRDTRCVPYHARGRRTPH